MTSFFALKETKICFFYIETLNLVYEEHTSGFKTYIVKSSDWSRNRNQIQK